MGRGEGDWEGEENQIFKNEGGEEYQTAGNFIHPCIESNYMHCNIHRFLTKL